MKTTNRTCVSVVPTTEPFLPGLVDQPAGYFTEEFGAAEHGLQSLPDSLLNGSLDTDAA